MASRVWSKFQVTKHDGSLVKMRIQDLPENRITEAMDLFLNFTYEETFYKAAGISQNAKALEEAKLMLVRTIKDPTSHNMICCEDKDDNVVGEIFGVSLMSLVLDVRNTGDPCKDVKLETVQVQIYWKLLNVMSKFYEAMTDLHIYHFYDDRGLYIHRGFRKLGLATELLRARCLACVAHNVPATGALFTATGTQKAAEKDNWETILVINLDEFGQQNGVTFEKGGVSKLMIWRNPQAKIQ